MEQGKQEEPLILAGLLHYIFYPLLEGWKMAILGESKTDNST